MFPGWLGLCFVFFRTGLGGDVVVDISFVVRVEGCERWALVRREHVGVKVAIVFVGEAAVFELLEVGERGIELVLEGAHVAAEEVEAVGGG